MVQEKSLISQTLIFRFSRKKLLISFMYFEFHAYCYSNATTFYFALKLQQQKILE